MLVSVAPRRRLAIVPRRRGFRGLGDCSGVVNTYNGVPYCRDNATGSLVPCSGCGGASGPGPLQTPPDSFRWVRPSFRRSSLAIQPLRRLLSPLYCRADASLHGAEHAVTRESGNHPRNHGRAADGAGAAILCG